ncbi:MAG: sugar ABC transporter permease [Caldilineaceae bacterium]|nr:sugar ABC transporter permease [Caldilineaceae bacterium]
MTDASMTSPTVQARRPVRRANSILHRRWWGNPVGYLFVGPGVLLYLLFSVYPIIRGLIMAFQDYRFLRPATRNPFNSFNGLENWIEMVHDDTFWHSLRVALTFTLTALPLNMLLGLSCAVLIASIPNRFAETVTRVIAYLPVILPISVAMLIWGMLYEPSVGYFSYFVTKIIPIWETSPRWLGFDWALPSTIVAWVWKQFGFHTLLFLIGIYGIPRSLYEAASIDGASAWGRFRYVTLPSLRPIFTLVIVLSAGIVSATEQMLILTGGGPAEETLTTGLYSYLHAFTTVYSDMRMGYAAAMNLVLGLVHMIVAGIVFKGVGTERA